MPEKAAEKIIGEGRFLSLKQKADGWEYVTRPNATGVVVIMPLTDRGEIVFIEQYRPPVKSSVIEFAAGLAGDISGQESEDLQSAAQRELIEECGYEAGEFILLTQGPPSAGLTDEEITLFLARKLRRVGPGGGDGNEEIKVHEVAISEVDAWLEAKTAEGYKVDPKVYSGLYFLNRYQ